MGSGGCRSFPGRPRWRLVFVGVLLIAGAARSEVRVDAPEPLNRLLDRYLHPPGPEAQGAALDAFARDARQRVTELLATEGYFSPTIEVRTAPGRLSVSVVPGPQTRVAGVDLEIRGDLAAERRAALLSAWPLKSPMPFRDADWREAKQVLLRELLAVDFPSALLVDSRVEIDPAAASAHLHAFYETGPRTVFNGLRISGLARYPPELVKRYSTIEPGAPYRQQALLALQGALQRTPYFSSVSVEIAPPEEQRASGGVLHAPVDVHVQERAPHRVSFGGEVSSNTGAQGEVIYQSFDFLRRAWQLDAGLRVGQVRRSLYADIRLPAEARHRDSFGALADREDIRGLERRRIAFGAVRTQVRGSVESRFAVNWQREVRVPENAPSRTNTALTLDAGWTARRVDDPLDPRRGYFAQVQIGGGSKLLLSDQNFVRLHGRLQHFFPLGKNDVLTLRGELGATLAPSREGIPEDFLFRAGGAQSVRGYAYQSLGVREQSAIVGGRWLAVAGAEVTHWFAARWGGAVFVDAGNAGDDRRALKPALGVGLGARWKSPAGPLAVDLAYGERDRRLRLHFSLAVAF